MKRTHMAKTQHRKIDAADNFKQERDEWTRETRPATKFDTLT